MKKKYQDQNNEAPGHLVLHGGVHEGRVAGDGVADSLQGQHRPAPLGVHRLERKKLSTAFCYL